MPDDWSRALGLPTVTASERPYGALYPALVRATPAWLNARGLPDAVFSRANALCGALKLNYHLARHHAIIGLPNSKSRFYNAQRNDNRRVVIPASELPRRTDESAVAVAPS
jgi:hypothetical protein